MLLAELIKEKDYIEKSIHDLSNFITALSMEEGSDISGYTEELEDLYSKYQKFSISIERAKNKSVIRLNDTKLSLSDACVIQESMKHKLRVYKGMLHNCFDRVGIYPKVLFDQVESIRLDIKTIGDEIDFALWNVEVS